jgi:hypothetical protein
VWTPAVVSSIGSDISDPYTTDQGCSAPADPNVGGEWAYHCNSSSHRYGIGAVGFGFFSESDRFDTAQNLGGQVAIDGGNFSLAPKGDNSTTGNGGLENNDPYIRYAAARVSARLGFRATRRPSRPRWL